MSDVIYNPALGFYVAAFVALVVVIGFDGYLWSIDRQLRGVQRSLRQRQPADQSDDAQRTDNSAAHA